MSDFRKVKHAVNKFFGRNRAKDFAGSNKKGLICKVYWRSNGQVAWGFLTVEKKGDEYLVSTRRDTQMGLNLHELFETVVFSDGTDSGSMWTELKQ